jgi:hypothetical protein
MTDRNINLQSFHEESADPEPIFFIRKESVMDLNEESNERKHTRMSSCGVSWTSIAKGIMMIAQVIIQIVILILLI